MITNERSDCLSKNTNITQWRHVSVAVETSWKRTVEFVALESTRDPFEHDLCLEDAWEEQNKFLGTRVESEVVLKGLPTR